MFEGRVFRSIRVVLLTMLVVSLVSSHALAGWGTVAICRCGCGFWAGHSNYPSPLAAEKAMENYFQKAGHKIRHLETSNKRYLVVAFAEGRKGIGWEFSDDQNEALDRAIAYYRRSFGRPHQFYIFDNERGGEVVKGVID